ncbi:hypothetical protein BHF71_09585 [Vulcanibacillus modesticaldus]|uniref:Endolytic murein transglycosylase n=1 Tax=Vulcanibacillus modesticaldus TaxID=337097 RepID=A0A1D2YU91_9BACI|nr:endolytic transglycosylase MltG [Vulcanibacillus modesticaldus]OEF99233.1 hypothetical protein BHF71_09585 [Vulcanibacillus modesticaldus]
MAKKNSLLFIIFGLIIISFTSFFVSYQIQAVNPTEKEKFTVTIPQGSSTSEIAEILKKEQLIKNKLFFKSYVNYLGYDMQLKAGYYELSRSMNLTQIIKIIAKGNNKIDSVRFTIPEGYTVEQIAARLAQQGLVQQDKFIQLAKDGDFDYTFIKQIPDNKDIKYRLEGYLFPNTYEVKKGATEREIINLMLEQFAKEWDPSWDKLIADKQLTIHQIVTIASIIEREVMVEKERPIVSGVIYNRLNKNWKLQIDATIQYILGKQKERLMYADLEVDNPYNTYLNNGLPPGPISNPGLSSIKAALFPENNDYFFYVTKKNNTGEHYFATTYNEHLRNIKKSNSP